MQRILQAIKRVRLTKERSVSTSNADVVEQLLKRYKGIDVFVVVLTLLAIAIIWTAVATALQVQSYQQDYRQLQDMQSQHRRLQVEQQRLLIEQQTFSATPQIAARAVTELGMRYPSVFDIWVMQPTPIEQDSSTSEQTHE